MLRKASASGVSFDTMNPLITTQSWVLYDCLQVFKSIAHKAAMAVYLFAFLYIENH